MTSAELAKSLSAGWAGRGMAKRRTGNADIPERVVGFGRRGQGSSVITKGKRALLKPVLRRHTDSFDDP